MFASGSIRRRRSAGATHVGGGLRPAARGGEPSVGGGLRPAISSGGRRPQELSRPSETASHTAARPRRRSSRSRASVRLEHANHRDGKKRPENGSPHGGGGEASSAARARAVVSGQPADQGAKHNGKRVLENSHCCGRSFPVPTSSLGTCVCSVLGSALALDPSPPLAGRSSTRPDFHSRRSCHRATGGQRRRLAQEGLDNAGLLGA